jgi:hypothetical protein
MSNIVKVADQETGKTCVPISCKWLPVSIKHAIEEDMKENLYFGSAIGSAGLPIETIDTLKVKCKLVVNHNGISIIIHCDNLQMYAKAHETTSIDGKTNTWQNPIGIRIEQILFRKTYIKKLTKYTLKDYESVLRHVYQDINLMKFDKLNGVLATPEIRHPKETPHISGHCELTNLPCLDPDDCCVCLDITKTTTACGHKLCVSCWSSLKRNGDELPCPICRDDLFQTRKIFGEGGLPVGHNGSDDEDFDGWDDWSDSDDDDDDQYSEFPSVRQNSIMDIN